TLKPHFTTEKKTTIGTFLIGTVEGDLHDIGKNIVSMMMEVRNEVRERIKEMASGGGYILSSSHRITPDMPFENIAAMYEAVREFGKYPIR
ncbi:MAG: hypothetical protein M1461_05130, partial [Nitrospirae bacterium]|nr:hypothetical protein [Nitrospirota bacterium]